MQKTAVFIGGIHGSGKTTMCSHMQFLCPLVAKQRHVLWGVAQERGCITWPEAARYHDELIEVAADRLSAQFAVHPSNMLLVDCHYAIRTDKALRHQGRDLPTEHVADLDHRFVSRLAQHFSIAFVLLDCPVAVAAGRLQIRPPELLDFSSTSQGLQKLVIAERELFLRMLVRFHTAPAYVLWAEETTEQNIKAFQKALIG